MIRAMRERWVEFPPVHITMALVYGTASKKQNRNENIDQNIIPSEKVSRDEFEKLLREHGFK